MEPTRKRGRPRKVPTPETRLPFRISLTLRGSEEEYSGEGGTLTEALLKVPTPSKITTKGFLKVTDGVKDATICLMPNRLKLFMRPFARKFQAKKLELLLR